MPTSTNDAPSVRPFSVLAVVVVYRQLPAETTSLMTLLETFRSVRVQSLRYRIVVADNTPGGQQPGPLAPGIEYRPYPANPGLALPYNDAIATAREEGFEWVLTLDQDTRLPANFMDAMVECARRYADDHTVAAIVPRIVDNGRPISPFRFVGGFLPVVLSGPIRGVAPRSASALNSASLLRITSLVAVGGYDPSFPLHNSDTRLYQKLDEKGLRMAVVDEMVVPHELSILDRQNRITPARYRSMLEDECDFWDRHMSFAGRSERFIRLAGRACKGLLRGEASAFQRVTLAEMWRRLSTTKRGRIQARDAEAVVHTVI